MHFLGVVDDPNNRVPILPGPGSFVPNEEEEEEEMENGYYDEEEEQNYDPEVIRKQNEKYVEELYSHLTKKYKRDKLYRTDLLYDMFPIHIKLINDDELTIWWMPLKHPIAQLLLDDSMAPIAQYYTKYGDLIIYTNDLVENKIDYIIKTCAEFGYTFIEEKEKEEEQEIFFKDHEPINIATPKEDNKEL